MRITPQWNGPLFLSILREVHRHVSTERGLAPHKPVVLFLAIHRLHETGSSVLIYEKEFRLIRKLIKNFDKMNSVGAEYPFWYLQNDKVFEVSYIPPLRMRKGKDFPPHRALIDASAIGKLPFWIEQLLRRDSDLVEQALRYISQKLLMTDLEILKSVNLNLSSKK